MALSEKEKSIRRRLRDDFPHYAAKCLKIRTKDSGIQPLVLNKAQLYIHGRLEAQLAEKGYVRAWILKGRQQGASTYTEARFFWKTTHRHGCRAMILTHMQDATDNLFGMVDRYYDHCPELVRPHKGTSNAKELVFDRLDSSYRAATAGSKGAGRSETIQLLHGSEIGYWPNADEHLKGALQAVPLAPGTEIIGESTANGIGNAFHRAWQDAESGKSDFIAVFVPWYWQDEYRREVPEGFTLSDSEREYKEAYGLDDGQMAWRRAKIVELRGDEVAFRQEYPATAAEAFEQSGKFSLIKPEHVLRARKAKIDEGVDEPLIIGVDLGGLTSDDIVDETDGDGTDNATIVRRRGRVILPDYDKIPIIGAMAMVGKLARILEIEKPDMMFIDLGNGGHILVDRLYELGYRKIVTGVNFGGAPIVGLYQNKRVEMYDTMRQWFEDDGGAQCPDSDEFQADVTAVRRKDNNSYGKMGLESKADMRRRGVRSPDIADGAALTFAFPVARAAIRQQRPKLKQSAYNPLNFRPG